ncbi:penicillin-binding protein 2 [Hydrogenovibrio marinus]|uniref:Peptidoglycan D,D-transpeptidase MrdA n=1 Tax=Hydrogenovibrio marinus TaxID=28885 RepID=A0A066ZRU7_HYDMR|nr:penicillin-binding protein 2 [Hydrogenovibrio marinus]KDN96538.1 peptidoglycan glycosyltransferase [Hydrogenovibrio marinus]BBN60256.1 penicillin-binding protein [Hydrogenovibrio marinus]
MQPRRNNYQSENEVNQQKLLFRGRLYFALGFVIVFFLVLFGRMSYLQWLNYDHYHAMSEGNRISVEALPPVRGKIYDRNNVLLADNQPVFALKFSKDKIDNIDATINLLKKLLPDIPDSKLEKFYNRLKVASKYRPIYLPYSLSESEASVFAANSYQFSGVTLTGKLKRIYPFGPVAVHAIGYVGKINPAEVKTLNESDYQGTDVIGKTGVERTYESVLHGKPGLQQVETNARGKVIRKLETEPATPGKDIQLTIDIRLQKFIEEYLGNKKAAVVVIEPKTGEILAYVSSPGYDPNLFVDGISSKNYSALLHNPYRPLINRVINGQYPPGSTIKPFVALSAIENGVISPYTKISDPGYFDFKNHRYRDWKRGGHGLVDMNKAITESCDTYFYELSLKMGIQMIHDDLYPFGFGHTTGIDLHGESSGILPSKEWKRETKNKPWFKGETIIAAIGQGYFLATPIQLAKAVAIMANRGKIITPHLLKGKDIEPQPQISIEKISNWEKVIKGMMNVMSSYHGTAYRYAKDLPFTIAGKTGTAQVFSLGDEDYDEENIKKTLRDHSLFIGFAPVKKPKIAISVIIENSSVKAAPVAVDIARYYLTQLHKDES